MNSPIRIGIIGAGANTRKLHIPKLLKIENVDLVCLANRSLNSGQKVASDFKISKVHESWKEVVHDPGIDAVVIGTWPNLHCEATCEALKAGKHVLTEARMAMDAAEARIMLQTSEAFPNLISQIVPAPFTLHADTTIGRILNEETLGRLQYFHFNFDSPPTTPLGAPLHWRRNIACSGLNAMVLGIAYESAMRWLGKADWVSATAGIFNNVALCPETESEIKVEIPDYLNVQTRMRNGMMGTFHITELGSTDQEPRFLIVGEKGMLSISFKVGGELRIKTGDDPWETVSIPEQDRGGWRVEEEFINAIRGKEPVKLTPFETGLDYMLFTEAVHRSWKMDGVPVSISDI